MSWTHLGDTIPKARRQYRCHLCGLPIVVGQEHVKRCGVDGEMYQMRMHIECEKLTDDWDEDAWLNFDEKEFRGELAQLKGVA